MAADELFVSIDTVLDVAYVVHEASGTLRWLEIAPANAAVLVAMGAHAHIELATSTDVSAR